MRESGEEVRSEHLLVSQSGAPAGLFSGLFPPPHPTVPYPSLFSVCPNQGRSQVLWPESPRPGSTKTGPGRKGVCPALGLSLTQVNSMHLHGVCPSPPSGVLHQLGCVSP